MEVKIRERDIKVESRGIKMIKYRGITPENSRKSCYLLGARNKRWNYHLSPGFVRGAEQRWNTTLRGCVRPIMGQSPIIGICSERGYSSWTKFSARARSPIVTCWSRKELIHIKGFITGFERARKSCQAKTEDDEAGKSSTRLLSLFLNRLVCIR